MNFYSLLMPLLQAAPVDSLPDFDLEGTVATLIHTPIPVTLRNAGEWFLEFSIKLALCLAIIWTAKKAIGALSRWLRKIIDRRRMDKTVSHFLINLLRVFLWLIIVWILISILGIDTSSVVALFASAGLAFGLALSGTLQNFAGGVMILIFKPFRTGDYISSQGEEGTVDDITIINTILITPDNRTVYLPNGATFSGIVRNTSRQRTRRIEWIFTIGYGNDYEQAKELLIRLLKLDSRILKDPAPFIALNKVNSGSIDIVVRVWVKSDDYWGVFYDLNEVVYKTFPANELSPSSPQMEVYLHPVKDGSTGGGKATKAAKTTPTHNEHHCDASAKPSGGES